MQNPAPHLATKEACRKGATRADSVLYPMTLKSDMQDPALRLATIEAAGQARVPFTSGILIGIGETRQERLDSLTALRDLHLRYGHIQVGTSSSLLFFC